MENINEKLMDYLDQNLTPEEMILVKNELDNSPELKQELAELISMMDIIATDTEALPSSRLQNNFDEMLSAQISLQNQAKGTTTPKNNEKANVTNLRSYYKYAAAAVALILVGVLMGRMYTQEEQIDQMSQDLYALLDEKSTSQRIKAVNMSHDMIKPSQDILNALIKTMNEDQSSNVRLAAVRALEKFTNEQKVIDAYISALQSQEDPNVTITLINILANIKAESAIQPLENLLKDEKHMQFVKDEAQVGIFKLTSI